MNIMLTVNYETFEHNGDRETKGFPSSFVLVLLVVVRAQKRDVQWELLVIILYPSSTKTTVIISSTIMPAPREQKRKENYNSYI